MFNSLSLKHKLLIFCVSIVQLMAISIFIFPPFPFVFSLKVHLFLHILGAVLFLGNILVGALWMIIADTKKSATIFHFTISVINLADIVFSTIGVLLLIYNGSVLSQSWGGLWTLTWLKYSLILFASVGLIWSFVLVPLQIYFEKMANNTKAFNSVYASKSFKIKTVFYFVFGSIAGILSSTILVLMVLK